MKLDHSLLLALCIAVTGQVLYHVMQKSVSPQAHPVLSLLVFYAVAMVLCLPLLIWFPLTQSIGQHLQELNWAVIGVAASIVLIELGFLLVYRHGGNLSSMFVFSAAAVAMALLLLGVMVFGEPFSLTKVAGVALCMLGVWLLSRDSAH